MGIRDFFARAVMRRRVKVYRIDDFSVEPPETKKGITRPKAHRIIPSITVNSSRPRDFTELQTKMKAPAVRMKLQWKNAAAINTRFRHYVKEDVKVQTYNFTKKPETSNSMLKQAQALPQERDNILKSIKKRPDSLKNEVILACYGPIVEGAVLKLVLNKQRGTLLVWYKAGSRQLKAKNVYLIRRLELGGKPEWRWV